MKKILFCLVIAFIWGRSAVYGQESSSINSGSVHEVRVFVKAKGTGRALGRSELKVGEQIVNSDPKGEIVLQFPKGLDAQATVSRAGYENEVLQLKDLESKKEINIFLRPAKPDDNEVVIRGAKRPEVSRKNVTVQESVRVAQGGDPVQVTKLLPGVQTDGFGPDIVVRGSGPNDSRYYIDAFEVPDIFHRVGNISVLPDQITSDVEFSSGGFGPQYGNATGGVVTLRTKSEIPEESKIDFRINIPNYSSIYYETPLGENSFIGLSARKSYIEYILPQVLPKDQGLTVVPYFYDMHAFAVQKIENGYYKYFAIRSGDGLKLAFPSDASTSEDGRANVGLFTGFTVFGVERFKSIGDGWSYSVSPQVGQLEFDLSFLDNTLRWGGEYASINTEFRYRRSKNESTYIGFQPTANWIDAKVKAPVPNQDPYVDNEEAPKYETSNNYTFYDLAAWFSHDLEFWSWIFTPGVRAFYFSQIEKSGVDPRLNIRYRINEENTFKAATGIFSRAPEVVEASKAFGNPDLDYEKSIHYILGIETNWTQKWTTDFQVFVKRNFDMIAGSASKKYDNTGSLQSKGFEAFIRRNMTERFFGWLSYTYSKTEARDDDRDEWRPSEFDQTHVVNLVGSYKLTGTWDLGLRVKYNTGDTYTPIEDSVYNAGLDKYQPRQGNTKTFSKRLPPYQQGDIFATKDFLSDTWKMSLRFGVQYLALKPQVFDVRYSYDYSKEEYFTGLPPIPFVELRGEF